MDNDSSLDASFTLDGANDQSAGTNLMLATRASELDESRREVPKSGNELQLVVMEFFVKHCCVF